MKIIVTGGAGFIGSNIVDELIEQDHDVMVVDMFPKGKTPNFNKHAKYEDIDILDDKIDWVFRGFSPDMVIHHAAQVNVQHSIDEPLHDARSNIMGTLAILEQCTKWNVQKLIFASTAAVYGTPMYLGIDEIHPITPMSPYAVSKHTSEEYVKLYSRIYGLDYSILRYANVYGIRQDSKGEGGVVSNFISKFLEKQPPVIFGNGEQTRDFIYVKDVVTANIAALTKGSKGVYNISCNQPTTINQLFKLLVEISGEKVTPIYMESRKGDIEHSYLENKLAEIELDWKPMYRLKEGLLEVYNSINKNVAVQFR